MKSLLLFSGGIDSTSVLFWKKPDIAITVNYGQVCADAEIQASRSICKEFNIHHRIIKIDCHEIDLSL